MNTNIQTKLAGIRRFLRYFRKAQTLYDLHSPLAYAFARDVLEDHRWHYIFSEAETLRSQWLQDNRQITVQDWGAGSSLLGGNERKIADLARTVATPPPFCRWLFQIVRFGRPSTLLELGTSLGISTLYQWAAALGPYDHPGGLSRNSRLAKQTLQQLHCPAELRIGTFADRLPEALAELGRLDHLYLDGDHSREGTLAYLNQCLPYTHAHTVWVIGDIHWSAEMEKAWKEIQAFPGVRMTIDLFSMGVVLFRQEILHPCHLVLAPSLWKPWRRGRWGGL
ncbi:MAG: class I SAM-dependent methyltransferase [Saprospirales bacterium]|nr:class I SAM-dependent methyltransferase [Saprospirales bacterium]